MIRNLGGKQKKISLISEKCGILPNKMNTFALEIWDDETSKVTFYTVRKLGILPQDDAEKTEADKFFDHYEKIEKHRESLNKLVELLIGVMGEDHGASVHFFNRFLNQINELPPKPGRRLFEIGLNFEHFPLRLFCLRLSDELVILFNGGEKTAQTTQQSVSLSLKFSEAQAFARRIEQAIQDKEIIINRKAIESGFGDEDIIL